MSEPVMESRDGVGTPDGFRRLWTPHRLAYIKDAGEGGCPFCRIPGLPDSDGLVVARGDAVYAVLNLHPYNPGHLMVVPYRHVAGLEELTSAESVELMAFTQVAIRAMTQVADPHAFNVGINLGSVAGGSLSEHLHQHVVPRWGGDANFIAVVGQTKVIPQLLTDTRTLLAQAWPAAAEAQAAETQAAETPASGVQASDDEPAPDRPAPARPALDRPAQDLAGEDLATDRRIAEAPTEAAPGAN